MYSLAIPARLTEDQIVGGSSDEVGIGEIVLAGVFELPDGSRCNASYWLPLFRGVFLIRIFFEC